MKIIIIFLLLIYQKLSKKIQTETYDYYTIQGKKCLSQFEYLGKIFNSCILLQTPDGQQTEKEWCMIDNDRNWDFCDFQEPFYLMKYQTQSLINDEIKLYKQINQNYQSQSHNFIKMNLLMDQFQQKNNMCSQNLNNLDLLYEDILAKQKKTNQQDSQIIDLNNKLLQIQQLNQQLDQQYQYIDSNQNLEIENIIDPLQHQFLIQNKQNCYGQQGYYPNGNGLNAHYYQNSNLQGDYFELFENQIDKIWLGNTNVKNINYEDFSIKWQGYLKSPITGNFIFKLDCDLQCQFILNNQIISNQNNTLSQEILLIAGQYYEIQIEYSHQLIQKFNEYDPAYISLSWQLPGYDLEIIPKQYLYTKIQNQLLQINEFDRKLFNLDELKEFTNIFIDSDSYKLADIPQKYDNAISMKSQRQHKQKEIQFETNMASNLYVAIEGNYNFLSEDFKDTNEILSVFELAQGLNKSDVYQSIRYKIYSKKIQKGYQKLEFKNSLEKNFIIFFIQENYESILSCGGQVEQISLITNQNYQDCSTSSQPEELGWDCKSAFSGFNSDKSNSMWMTRNEALGEWISIQFKQKTLPLYFDFYNKDEISARVKQLQLNYDDYQQSFQIRNILKQQRFEFENLQPVQDIKFTIKQTYGFQQSGGAFNIFGVQCVSLSKKNMEEIQFILSCDDTLKNKDQFQEFDILSKTLKIRCDDGCKNHNSQIFGFGSYSEDSSICKSAFHQGAIQEHGYNYQYKGGQFSIAIKTGLQYYQSKQFNGIKSSIKMIKDTFSFNVISDQINENDLVDYYNSLNDIWQAGIIDKIEQNKNGQKIVLIKVESSDLIFEEIFPNLKIAPCGSQLKSRICKNLLSIQILFGATKTITSDQLLDNGQQFGLKQSGYNYGWSKSLINNIRIRNLNYDPILDSLLLFPPDAKSKWCQNKQISCEPAFWKIKVPNGKYSVQVTQGDAKDNWQNDLLVNKQRIMKQNKIVKKGIFITKLVNIDVQTKEIILESQCEQRNCEFSWTRINNITISQIKQQVNNIKIGETINCGLTYFKGHCNQNKNVENCFWQNEHEFGVENCINELKLVKVYLTHKCQAIGYKCIKIEYQDFEECDKSCPFYCQDNICLN